MYHIQRLIAYLSKLSPFIIVIASLSVLFVFFMLAQYSHPSADDYCLASGIKEHGPFNYLWSHYFEWSGRYSGNALYGLYPLIFGLVEGYFLIPIILIVSLGMAFAYLVSTVFKISLFNFSVIASSVCFVCVYMLGMSSTAQGFYWMAGALSYQTGNILALVFIGLSIQFYDQQKKHESYSNTFILLLIVCIIIMGLNETIMLLVASYIGVASVLAYRSNIVRVKPWLIVSALAILCFCIVYFAPGNDVRSSHFAMRNDLSYAISRSWDYSLNSLTDWASDAVLILSSVLSLYLFYSLFSASNRIFQVSIKQIIILLSLTVVSPFLFSLPISWAIGAAPPERLNDTIYFFFILLWYMSIAAILYYFTRHNADHKFKRFIYIKKFINVLTTILYVYFISTDVNLTTAINDLQNSAPLHDKYMNERYALIEESLADEKLDLTVPGYDHDYPSSIFVADITTNAKDWTNVCFVGYYGLNEIRKNK